MSDAKFTSCLQKKLIRKFSRGPALIKKELDNARLDLKSAQESFDDENYKWATIQTYYSMFHSARALLYARQYREKSHWCLIVAIRQLYVKKGKLSFPLIEALQKAKTLREEADYYGEFTKENAKELIDKAKSFLKKAKRILKKKNPG